MAGDTEVKAQIRLQFRDITGQKCMAIRSLAATQKVIFINHSMSHIAQIRSCGHMVTVISCISSIIVGDSSYQ